MRDRKKDRLRPYLVVMLIALEIMLSFSSFGYITLGRFTLSFIPISIYAIAFLFGPKWGIPAGIIFGLTSMWMASVGAGTNLDYLYSPTLSGNPAGSIVLAVGTRIFLGLIAGITLQKVRKNENCGGWMLAAVTTCNQILYTAVSLAVGILLFSGLDMGSIDTKDYATHLLINLLVECIVFSVAVVVIDKMSRSRKIQMFAEYCRNGISKVSTKWTFAHILCLFMFCTVFSAGAFFQYLNMSRRVLKGSIDAFNSDTAVLLLQIELQQMLSNLALFAIIIVLVTIVYFYSIEHRNRLMYRADRDMMTGLYNRKTAKEKISIYREIHKGEPCTFLMIDVDGLKNINDTLGHVAGDEAIIGVANALKSKFRQTDIIGRMGGDEFIVFLGGIASEEFLSPILERLHKSVSEVIIAGDTRRLEVSIGVRLDQTGTASLDDLYLQADDALYCAKNKGKNTVSYYEVV